MQMISDFKPEVLLLDLHMPEKREYTPDFVKSQLCTVKHTLAVSYSNDSDAKTLAESYGAASLLDKMKLYTDLIPAIMQFSFTIPKRVIAVKEGHSDREATSVPSGLGPYMEHSRDAVGTFVMLIPLAFSPRSPKVEGGLLQFGRYHGLALAALEFLLICVQVFIGSAKPPHATEAKQLSIRPRSFPGLLGVACSWSVCLSSLLLVAEINRLTNVRSSNKRDTIRTSSNCKAAPRRS